MSEVKGDVQALVEAKRIFKERVKPHLFGEGLKLAREGARSVRFYYSDRESLNGVTAYLRWRPDQLSPKFKIVRARVFPILTAESVGLDYSAWDLKDRNDTHFIQYVLAQPHHLRDLDMWCDIEEEARLVSKHWSVRGGPRRTLRENLLVAFGTETYGFR